MYKADEINRALPSDKFMIIDAYSYTPLERNKFYKKNITSLGFIIAYNCTDEECTLDEEDYSKFDYYFELKYEGFKLDHQGEIPLVKDNNTFFQTFSFFSFTSTVLEAYSWEIVKYKEERGLLRLFDQWLDQKKEYSSGYISTGGSTIITHPVLHTKIISGKNVKVLAEFLLTRVNNTEFRRRKISILDILANVGALYMSIYSVFRFIFRYYSQNFDNYKIIESIIKKRRLNFSKKYKGFQNIESLDILDAPLNDNRENNKSSGIKIDENDLSINNETNDDIESNKEEKFKKISFLQFFYNNIYCKRCKKNNTQEIIEITNKIISNYLSIELVLYNQIMIESLFKDYKWNDEALKNIDNNELVIRLRNLLSQYG